VLHADTVLAEGWVAEAVDHIVNHPGKAAAFALAFDDPGAAAHRVAALANWRARTLGLPYGDQGLLVSRALLEAVGGFPDVPLMEDVAVVDAIGRKRLRHLKAIATTSSARYHRDGWWVRPLRNLALVAAWRIGVSPVRLARLYGR
jgi:hypothetical protein